MNISIIDKYRLRDHESIRDWNKRVKMGISVLSGRTYEVVKRKDKWKDKAFIKKRNYNETENEKKEKEWGMLIVNKC